MLYRPRMAALLTLPGAGANASAPVSLQVQVQSARLVRNDHTHADELHLVLDWHDAGMDPRLLSSAVGTFFLGVANDAGEWTPGPADVQFIGRMTRPMRHAGEDSPMVVEANFVDYTSFFILAKPFATKGIPTVDMTIADAWRCLVAGMSDDTGSSPVAALADAIEFRGLDAPGPVLGSAVAQRFRKKGNKLPIDPKLDAWAIWQRVVGSCGLISYFELDTLVVTTTTDLYTADKTPVLIWGTNVLSFNEERKNDFERKGVGITSFDPVTGTTLESLYPPVGDARVKGARVKATAKGKAPADLASKEHRDYFQFAGITDQTALDALAKRVWEERARQEIEGRITTAEMALQSTQAAASGAAPDELDVDLLQLRSGDTIRVELDELDWDGQAILNSFPTVEQRVQYLVGRGYSEQFATVIAQNLDMLVKTRRDFYVKRTTVDFQSTPEGGSFTVEINYCNKIETTLDATDDQADK